MLVLERVFGVGVVSVELVEEFTIDTLHRLRNVFKNKNINRLKQIRFFELEIILREKSLQKKTYFV